MRYYYAARMLLYASIFHGSRPDAAMLFAAPPTTIFTLKHVDLQDDYEYLYGAARAKEWR